jgi:hypothetical protein
MFVASLHQGFRCQIIAADLDNGSRGFISNSQECKNEQDKDFIFQLDLKRLALERSNGHEGPSEQEQLGAGNKKRRWIEGNEDEVFGKFLE